MYQGDPLEEIQENPKTAPDLGIRGTASVNLIQGRSREAELEITPYGTANLSAGKRLRNVSGGKVHRKRFRAKTVLNPEIARILSLNLDPSSIGLTEDQAGRFRIRLILDQRYPESVIMAPSEDKLAILFLLEGIVSVRVQYLYIGLTVETPYPRAKLYPATSSAFEGVFGIEVTLKDRFINSVTNCADSVLILDTRLSRIFPLTKLLDVALVSRGIVGLIQEDAHDIHHTATVYQGVYRPA